MPQHAVITTGGKQYFVTEGQTLLVEKLPSEPKAVITFDNVLLLTDGKQVKLGLPTVAGARVTCEVVAQVQGKKIYVETYRAKTRKHRKIGHRQLYTKLTVKKIEG